jgi:hypothetical protein
VISLDRLPADLAHGTRLFEAAILLAVTRVVLRASPRRLTARLLRRASGAGPLCSSSNRQHAHEVARDVNRIARLVPGSTCLGRALTGWLMLRRRGVASVVRVGARRVEAGVRMHAWLEVGGDPLIGRDEAAGFVVLTR